MDNLIFYDRKIPYLEILRILRKYEEKQVTGDIEKLKNIEIPLEGSVIDLNEIARKYDVNLDALLSDIMFNKNANDYLRIGNQLVDSQTVKAVQDELNGVKKYDEALITIEKYGIKGQQVFDILGYKVKWSGLDPENAEIVKM